MIQKNCVGKIVCVRRMKTVCVAQVEVRTLRQREANINHDITETMTYCEPEAEVDSRALELLADMRVDIENT